MTAPLAGCSVLVTRPAHQAGGLLKLLEEAGASALPMPMQLIEFTPPHAVLMQQLAEAQSADWWVFTSANAVRAWQRLGAPPIGRQCAAIGPATAQVLEDLGQGVDLVPEQHNSEGLLSCTPFDAPDGLRVVIVSGEGGRNLLQPALQGRGAQVRQLALYRRRPSAVTPDAVAKAVADSSAVVVTNAEALQRLAQLCDGETLAELQHRQLVVPSARVVELAQTLGFVETARVPVPLNDAQIVRTLIDWRCASAASD